MVFPFGTKKIKDILIDKKVSPRKRNQLLLMQIAHGDIVWIPEAQIASSLRLGNKPLYLQYTSKG